MQATIDLQTKTEGVVEVDIWYSTIYELAKSYIDLDSLATMEDIFNGTVRFQPRVLTRNCQYCSEYTQENLCILRGKFCPLLPNDD